MTEAETGKRAMKPTPNFIQIELDKKLAGKDRAMFDQMAVTARVDIALAALNFTGAKK